MEAMCFALFGTFPQSSRGRVKLEELSGGRGETQVALAFDAGEEMYEVERRIEKGAEANLRKGKMLVCTGAKKVNDSIKRVLEVDYEAFVRAIYSEQNQIDRLLSLEPGRRKAEIDELLGLDKFEAARASATGMANVYEKLRQEAQKGFDAEKLEEEKKKLLEKKREEKELSEKLAELGKEYKRLSEELGKVEGEMGALRELKGKHKKMEGELLRQKGMLEALSGELGGRKYEGVKEIELGALEAELAEIEGKIAKIEGEARKRQLEENAVLVEVRILEKRIEEERGKAKKRMEIEAEMKRRFGERKIKEMQKEEEDAGANVLRISGEIEKGREKTEQAKKVLEVIGREGDACPVCESQLEEKTRQKLIAQRKGEIEKQEREMLVLEKTLILESARARKAKREVEELRGFIAKLEGIGKAESVEGLMEEIEKKGKSAALLKGENEKEGALLLEGRKRLEEIKERRRLALEFAKKNVEREEAEKKVEKLGGEIGKSGFSEVLFEERGKKLQELALATQGVEKEMKFGKLQEGEMRELVHEMEKTVKMMEGEREKIVRAGESQKLASILKNCLALSQREIRGEYVGSINDTLSIIWPVVYPYGDYEKVRIRADEKDYFFEMLSLGEWKGFEGFASGGERSCLSLALRIAIASVLTPKVSMLILDEPTHNLDENAIEKLGKTLSEEIPKIVEQVFVITHERKLAGMGFGKTYLLERDKEKNEPTRVELVQYTA
nr:hypothetical protein [uncultured archaeon]